MCNCISEINKKLEESNLNTRIKEPIILGNNMELQGSKVQIVTEKVDSKIRKKAVAMFSSFCPFCGDKYIVKG